MGLFMAQSQLFDMNLYGEELQATHSDTLLRLLSSGYWNCPATIQRVLELPGYYPAGIGTEPKVQHRLVHPITYLSGHMWYS